MRNLKMFGLAVAVAAALAAVVGASSASAATTMCSKNESPCMAGNTYGMGTKIEAKLQAGKAVLESTFAKVECGKSEIKSSYEDNSVGGNPTGKISALTFEECGACKVTILAKGSLEVTTEEAKANGNGTLIVKGVETTIECAPVSCIFTTGAAGVELADVTGGNPALFKVGVLLSWVAGDANKFVCSGNPGLGKWEGSYEITSPKPLFIQ